VRVKTIGKKSIYSSLKSPVVVGMVLLFSARIRKGTKSLVALTASGWMSAPWSVPAFQCSNKN